MLFELVSALAFIVLRASSSFYMPTLRHVIEACLMYTTNSPHCRQLSIMISSRSHSEV